VAVAPGAAGATAVSVSWNGATEVTAWQVLSGATPTTLSLAASVQKSGFQTTVTLPSAGAYIEVQALNAAGATIGASAVVKG
jgi:hypothetical protein